VAKLVAASYRCPCCNYLTFEEPMSFEICEVCFWQDDGQDDSFADAVRGGANHELSLTQARRNFRRFGAIAARFIMDVRAPLPEEV